LKINFGVFWTFGGRIRLSQKLEIYMLGILFKAKKELMDMTHCDIYP
jgi:hypothetical protein